MNYKKQTFAGKDVYIVEKHHHALMPWTLIRRDLLSAPRLITLDHHTDTKLAFLGHIYNTIDGNEIQATSRKLITTIDWKNSDKSVTDAVGKLCYDEHIHAATMSGILSLAFAINLSHENTKKPYVRPPDGIFKIGSICKPQCSLQCHNEDCRISRQAEVIESSYLDHELGIATCMAQSISENLTPYILDIDLDYFHSEKAIQPNDSTTFHKLILEAQAITIAREPTCVIEHRIDNSKVDSDYLERELLKHIKDATSKSCHPYAENYQDHTTCG